MALYLIAFNDEWVPDLTLEEVRERGTSGRALIEEMTAAGVFVFSDGGLDASTAVCSVDPSSGSPVFTDGPFTETKELVAGFWIWQVKSLDEAVEWLKKAPFEDGEVEIRRVFELEDFGAELDPELRKQEEEMRAKSGLAAKH